MKCVAFDIGETLTCDDRYWASWADWLDVPHHTLSAPVGAVVAQGRDNADALRLLRPDIDLTVEYAARERAGLGELLTENDLYPDVRPALAALCDLGVRVVVAGNQTRRAGESLRSLGLPADAVAVSEEWGTAKPDVEFFHRVTDLARAEPEETLYVGDHPANDVFPAREAGLLTAHLRRGPWGRLWADTREVLAAADWSVSGLGQLASVVAGK
ncbi:HAD family hydrolase [Streptomyces sedi]|uniref:HAD family hydrolase n=1 Tax=Streptomyces sedi TaxID=555059 RepID=A0A5C4V0N6_9ACTN|nr:HAD family hydrolase [Streptomyces sedi]